MTFNLMGWMMNPYVLMFLAVLTGLLFGKIRFGKFNFGISGALFTGLLIGWFVQTKASSIVEGDAAYKTAQSLLAVGVVDKVFFTLFLILFVAAVGLLASKEIGLVIRKYGVKFVLLGFTITLLGAAATYGMTYFSKDANPYEVSGVYTGALTSSPGLAAALETAEAHATEWVHDYEGADASDQARLLRILDGTGGLTPENTPTLSAEQSQAFVETAKAGIGIGHAIGYPFGVLVVIIAVNFFPRIFGMDLSHEMTLYQADMRREDEAKIIDEVDFDLLGFVLACLFGYTIGQFKLDLSFIGLGDFSLGSTGGVLIGSLLLGYVGKIGFINFRMNAKILGVVRQVSLAFFLAIVGLRYGFGVFEALMGAGAYLAVVALVVGLVAMLIGFFIGRYVFKINWIMLSGAICGGMTSTPGLGAAVDAVGSDDPAAGYGATYPFALLGMVIFTIILHRLPM